MKRMFKLAGRPARVTAPVSPAPARRAGGYSGRRDLLARIGEFLLDHSLAVNPANLALAHGVVSGSDVHLARLIAERRLAREPVTQAWLDETASHGRAAGRAGDGGDPDRIMTGLDRLLQDLASQAQRAGGSAAEFHALAFALAGTAPDIAGLTDLARAMIDHAAEMQDAMRRAEGEAAALRRELEQARTPGIDHQTGLADRRAFEALLDGECRAARAAGDPLSVAFCDIDGVGLINETHGHPTGDRVIQAVAKLLQRVSGRSCHLARHGGEEFVLLFRGTPLAEVRRTLDDAREDFARRRLVDRETDIPIGTVSFSGGIADVLACEDPRAALKAADAALHRAKQLGRNRIEVAPTTTVIPPGMTSTTTVIPPGMTSTTTVIPPGMTSTTSLIPPG